MLNYTEIDSDLTRYAKYVQMYSDSYHDYLHSTAKARSLAYIAAREVLLSTDTNDPLALAAYEAALQRIENT
jgi:hypothetical protein